MNVENANPGPPNDWPNIGSVVQRLTGQVGDLPTAVRLPNHIFNTDGSVWPGQDGGMSGPQRGPLAVQAATPASADFRIQ